MALPRYIPHYKVEDYQLWEGAWELWSGVAVSMSPSAKRLHQEVCGELYLRLREALAKAGCQDCTALFELDWIVNEDTVLRPDLMVLCGGKRSDFVQEPPVFVIEVLSESTRKRDLVYKRELYEQLGVAYYLTVEPEDGSWRLLKNETSGYTKLDSTTLELSRDCRVTLDLTRLTPT